MNRKEAELTKMVRFAISPDQLNRIEYWQEKTELNKSDVVRRLIKIALDTVEKSGTLFAQ